MIFRQIDEIVSGRKTQTRRIVKANEELIASGVVIYRGCFHQYMPPEPLYRLKWEVGRNYAVVPGRGKHGEMVHCKGFHFTPVRVEGGLYYDGDGYWFGPNECQPLRICITAIRQERLQDITETDARAEGVKAAECYRAEYFAGKEPLESYVEGYRQLWNQINARKGTRWADNPLAWVLTFEVVS